jgi:hypothetical protein
MDATPRIIATNTADAARNPLMIRLGVSSPLINIDIPTATGTNNTISRNMFSYPILTSSRFRLIALRVWRWRRRKARPVLLVVAKKLECVR